jgi:hypothetical protein
MALQSKTGKKNYRKAVHIKKGGRFKKAFVKKDSEKKDLK